MKELTTILENFVLKYNGGDKKKMKNFFEFLNKNFNDFMNFDHSFSFEDCKALNEEFDVIFFTRSRNLLNNYLISIVCKEKLKIDSIFYLHKDFLPELLNLKGIWIVTSNYRYFRSHIPEIEKNNRIIEVFNDWTKLRFDSNNFFNKIYLLKQLKEKIEFLNILYRNSCKFEKEVGKDRELKREEEVCKKMRKEKDLNDGVIKDEFSLDNNQGLSPDLDNNQGPNPNLDNNQALSPNLDKNQALSPNLKNQHNLKNNLELKEKVIKIGNKKKYNIDRISSSSHKI